MKYVTKTFKVELVSDGPDLGAPLRSSEDVFRYARSIRRWTPIKNISCSLFKTTKTRQ